MTRCKIRLSAKASMITLCLEVVERVLGKVTVQKLIQWLRHSSHSWAGMVTPL